MPRGGRHQVRNYHEKRNWRGNIAHQTTNGKTAEPGGAYQAVLGVIRDPTHQVTFLSCLRRNSNSDHHTALYFPPV